MYLALGALTLGFFLALGQRQVREWLLAAHVLVLIFVIHGTPSILYGTLRYAWAWKHVGIVDYIDRHGSVDPDIGYLAPYHNWPGFFALSALFTKLAGFQSALSFASWAPVFFNLLFLAALVTQGLSSEGVGFHVPLLTLAIFTVIAILAGIAAAVVPARRAARLNVLEALQYE